MLTWDKEEQFQEIQVEKQLYPDKLVIPSPSMKVKVVLRANAPNQPTNHFVPNIWILIIF